MDLTLMHSLIEAVRKSFEDPDVQKEYERWIRDKEEQQDSGEQV